MQGELQLFQALDNSVKKLKSEMEEMTKTLATMEKVDEARVEMPAKSKEQLERETLDVELELMNASIGPPTADLQRRLADLKRQLLAAPTAGALSSPRDYGIFRWSSDDVDADADGESIPCDGAGCGEQH
jgi:hypothetical protein